MFKKYKQLYIWTKSTVALKVKVWSSISKRDSVQYQETKEAI